LLIFSFYRGVKSAKHQEMDSHDINLNGISYIIKITDVVMCHSYNFHSLAASHRKHSLLFLSIATTALTRTLFRQCMAMLVILDRDLSAGETETRSARPMLLLSSLAAL
jgi:hypothetical protein